MSTRRFITRLPNWTWAHRLTAAAFLVLLLWGHNLSFPWLQGSPTATRLTGWIPFLDPLAAFEVVLASRAFNTTLLLGAGATLLFAFALGRVFCGWLCPLGLALELNNELREWFQRVILRRRRVITGSLIPTELKYWLLALCLGLSLMASVPVFTMVSPINLVVLSVFAWPQVGLVVLGVIAVVEYLLPRVFCRSICPLGALYSIVGRLAPLRIRVRAHGERLLCRQCTLRCPMGIPVMEDFVLAGKPSVDDGECTRCGTCTDACAGHVLRLGFRSRDMDAANPVQCPSESDVPMDVN